MKGTSLEKDHSQDIPEVSGWVFLMVQKSKKRGSKGMWKTGRRVRPAFRFAQQVFLICSFYCLSVYFICGASGGQMDMSLLYIRKKPLAHAACS